MSATGPFITNDSGLIPGEFYYKLLIQRDDLSVSIDNPSQWKIIGKRYEGEYVEKGNHPNPAMKEDSFIFDYLGVQIYVRLQRMFKASSQNASCYEVFIARSNLTGIETIQEMGDLPGEGIVAYMDMHYAR
jgi:hypothetical protein